MTAAPQAEPLQALPPHPRRRLVKPAVRLLVIGILAYLAVAYLLLPAWWTRHARRHPLLEDVPRVTRTGNGIPGDPLNVGLIGTETELKQLMLAAQWYPADRLTLRSCLAIATDTVLRRPYDDAPVSSLFLFGRKQDLAFERPVGHDPRRRHHVRFWLTPAEDADGRPVWVGAATYDLRVGLSHRTGQVTHHIAADIDAERDALFGDLERTGRLAEVYPVSDFHAARAGRNGGGDPWHTDGVLSMGVIRPDAAP